MEFKNVLLTAAKTADDRNTSYGTHDECFGRIAKIASAFFEEEIDEYKIAMILLFVKLGRIGDNKKYADNYVDGVNYLAFASHFADKSMTKDVLKSIDDFEKQLQADRFIRPPRPTTPPPTFRTGPDEPGGARGAE